MIRERFCRDQQELLLRTYLHIRQTTTVQDYVDCFVDLIEQLSAYTPNSDHIAYVTHLVDGLRDDIRAVVFVQRPKDLDSACILALLQEETIEPRWRHEGRQLHAPPFVKPQVQRGALPLPPPPARAGPPPQGIAGLPVEPRRPQDDHKPPTRPLEERFQSLRDYRKSRGLCVRYGERWQPGHRCAPQVQLHALQELWDVCQDEFEVPGCSTTTDVTEPTDAVPAQAFMLSAAVHSGAAPGKTMQFQGSIQGHPILILLDSGSTNSFVSSSLSDRLHGISDLLNPITVHVADGNYVMCTQEIPMAAWSVQGYEFHSNLKVLSLGSYDMIIGMDWLEAFSPMKVQWLQKWICIPYGSIQVLLRGQHPHSAADSLVQVYHIASDASDSPKSDIMPEVQLILDDFASVFAEPSGLPPRRACDHKIPLVPGAQPVSVRPYRYAPTLKSEIERQVTQMLNSGLIRPSTSAFPSPVLLVRKKTGDWRLCVDYHMLNALTVKSKFPIPVIDELLDELAHAKWFSVLDLRAGFNQIRLAPGEEYKTAFQTHWGQF